MGPAKRSNRIGSGVFALLAASVAMAGVAEAKTVTAPSGELISSEASPLGQCAQAVVDRDGRLGPNAVVLLASTSFASSGEGVRLTIALNPRDISTSAAHHPQAFYQGYGGMSAFDATSAHWSRGPTWISAKGSPIGLYNPGSENDAQLDAKLAASRAAAAQIADSVTTTCEGMTPAGGGRLVKSNRAVPPGFSR